MEVLDLQAAEQVGMDTARCKLFQFRPTYPQTQVLSDDARSLVWVDGNQLGKTTAMLVDLIHRCRGTHPWQQVRKPPVNVMIAGFSIEQMGQPASIMEKLWELLPKDEINVNNSYRRGFGITGKPPRIEFVSGPGKGSVIAFGTYRQDVTRFSSMSLHHLLADEPPPSDLMAELYPRLLRNQGSLRICFTPVPNMPDQGWLRKLIEEKKVECHNYGLEESHCLPTGSPFPFVTQDEIDALEAALPPYMRGMRIRGEWDPVLEDRWLQAFTKETHCLIDDPPEGATVIVGIDHGIVMGKQTAVVIAVSGGRTLAPRVWVLNESTTDKATTTEEDARSIIHMLQEVGLEWSDVDHWVGDRKAGDHRHLVRKSNALLRRQLAAVLDLPQNMMPKLHTPRKFRGSVVTGLTLVNAICASRFENDIPGMIVSPRCKNLVQAMWVFNGDPRDPCKDVLDAMRYAVERGCSQQAALTVIGRYG